MFLSTSLSPYFRNVTSVLVGMVSNASASNSTDGEPDTAAHSNVVLSSSTGRIWYVPAGRLPLPTENGVFEVNFRLNSCAEMMPKLIRVRPPITTFPIYHFLFDLRTRSVHAVVLRPAKSGHPARTKRQS